MIGIYKITNPNNKVYIGQSNNIEKRFSQHRLNTNNKENNKLYESFRLYNIENHIFEIIEECSIELLNERERYWQDYYNVLENGLNLRLTSCSGKLSKCCNSVKKNISKALKDERKACKITIVYPNGKTKGCVIRLDEKTQAIKQINEFLKREL